MPLSGQSEDATGYDEPPRKRARTTGALEEGSTLSSLRASISPPRPRITQSRESSNGTPRQDEPEIAPGSLISSPFQLTRIRDSPGSLNNGSVSLGKIVCDPMIREMWQFNYMHDLDFLMSNMDPDTKDMVKIHVVHGYWKKESGLHMKVSFLLFYYMPIVCSHIVTIRVGLRIISLLADFSISESKFNWTWLLAGEVRFDMITEPSTAISQCSSSLCIYARDIWYS
jgi:hypothetical protein